MMGTESSDNMFEPKGEGVKTRDIENMRNQLLKTKI